MMNLKLIFKFALGFFLIGVEVPLFQFGYQGHDLPLSMGISALMVIIGLIIFGLFKKGFDEINKIKQEEKTNE